MGVCVCGRACVCMRVVCETIVTLHMYDISHSLDPQLKLQDN